MKNGKSLTELAIEIERRQNAKRDFIADTREVTFDSFSPDAPQHNKIVPRLVVDGERFPITDICHRQIGDRTQIPAKYYDRMREEAPQLLGMNVNHWFKNNHERRLIRTLDGSARALLSDRYHRIDNEHIAEVILPVLAEVEGLKVVSCEITERRMYIKAVNERLQADVKVGDTVEAGVMITNSEVGAGAVVIAPLVHRLICLNGMVVNDHKFRRNHVGAQADTSEAVYEMLSDEALQADDKAILLKARDVVRASLDSALFEQTVAKMRAATEGEIMADPVKAIEKLGQKVSLLEGEKTSVLAHLIQGGDLSRYGMLNAVTRAAQDVESYDRSTDLEQIGGTILELAPSQWNEMAIAA